MGFIKLNRYGDPAGTAFDPEGVLQMIQGTFSNVKVLPGDQLALSTERAAAQGAADHVVQTLRRNKQAYGPAYAFEIPLEDGKIIEGRARRFDVTFLFGDPLPEDWCKRLRAFLHELGPGKIETEADRQ